MTTIHTAFLKSMVLLLVVMLCGFRLNAQTISSFSPTSGSVGTTVTITGTGFNTTTTSNIVFFGATMASVSAATATSLTVTVPYGVNYQYITVTNLSTNLTAYSAKPFNVTTLCSTASTFAAAVVVQGGSQNVEICDMDLDGKPDLIIPDYFNNVLAVTRNTSTPGTISFAAKVTFPWASGGQPNEVSIGDFDGDGKPDVALGGNGGGTFVSVYRNTSTPGAISFATRVDFTASSGQGNGNKVIDIDGDGKPDLLSVHWSGNCLWVLRNTSSGVGNISFAAGVSFTTTSQPHKIDVGDLDGDGKPDVVITAFTSNTMSVFRNTSSPGAISFATRQDFAPGTVPYFVHIGDLDGDGKADIAVVNRDVATLAVYRNTSLPGTISFATKQDFATMAGTMTHYGVAFGDLDGDGKPDIAVGNYTLNKTSVFKNTSASGAISFATRVDLSAGISYDLGIDDFDGDGRPDIAVTNSGSTVSILMNTCLTLPIELFSFTAKQQSKEVLLAWSTASEVNNDYFSLERSSNAIDFESIGDVNGAGTSKEILNYFFTDEHPGAGINYYRLKQTDYDGQHSYSNIEAVDFRTDPLAITAYPNPFNNELTIQGTKTGGLLIVYDVMGKEVYRQETMEGATIINAEDLKAGIYLLHYTMGNKPEELRMVKF
ncbi:MAG: T9SS type A sorting domain-containing protein [Chitinophagaceae bacterium]|nr:T9SS type A sorting domain-containing protein [Chitinophagaceae bacterium]